MKNQDKVYSKQFRDGYDKGLKDGFKMGEEAGYKKGVFAGMKHFQNSQKSIQI